LGIEPELHRSITQNLSRQVRLPHPVAGSCYRVVAMSRQVGQNATKAHGAETLCDEQVVFLSPPAAMHKDQIASHAPRGWQGEAFLRQLLTDHLPTFSQASTWIRLTDEAGSAIGTGEGFQYHAVSRRIRQKLPMIILQRSAWRMCQLISGQPAGQRWYQQKRDPQDDSFSFHVRMMSKIVRRANLVMLPNSRS
jgi:hypothetical protein